MTTHIFYSDYIEKIRSLLDQFRTEISDLPQDALDWSPSTGQNSVAVLAVHSAGSFLYWFSDVIAGIPSGRDRAAEFLTSNLPVGEIVQKLDRSFELAQRVINQLTIEDLSGNRFSARDRKSYNVGWALLHIYEHTALHLGHLQVTRQMWEARDDKA
jgi:hypothetical protein